MTTENHNHDRLYDKMDEVRRETKESIEQVLIQVTSINGRVSKHGETIAFLRGVTITLMALVVPPMFYAVYQLLSKIMNL